MGIFLVSTIGVPIAYAEDGEIDTRFLPSKLVENSEITMYVYATEDENILPTKIEGIRASSLDSSIVRVVEVKSNEGGFMAEVLLETGKPGETTITVTAPGYSSVEIPIEVNGNKLNQKQILIKTIPDSFEINSLTSGIVSVQLGDEDGFPVIATKDTVVTLSSSDSSIVDIPQKDLIIEAGEYFAVGNFNIKSEGEARIYASSLGLDSVNTEIDIDEAEELTVELYVFPEKLNSETVSKGHIIAQLQGDGGEPVIAKENIRLDLRILNDDFTDSTNLSDDLYNSIKTIGYFDILKGSYWGHTTFSPLTGIEDTYEVTISSKNPLAIVTQDIETINSELFDDKIVKLETVPILATGERELIGILYLEDEIEDPVIADKDLVIRIDSSDEEFLQIESTLIPEGSSSALVFAKVGNSIPDDAVELVTVTEEAEIVTPELYGPDEDSLDLVAEPIISKILVNTEFPVALYVEDTEAEVFPENSNVVVSPSEFFEIDEIAVNKGEGIVIMNAKSLKKGDDELNISIKNYDTELDMESLVSSPTDIELDYSDSIFSGLNDVFSIQLLNDEESPVFTSQDIEVQLALKDNEMLDIPEFITIKKGQYFTNFDVTPLSAGETELSIFGEDLPLKTYDIEISSLEPEIEIMAPEIIEESDSFDASIIVTHNGNPLEGSSVKWNTEGAIMQIADQSTATDGKASAFFIGTAQKTIQIDATISGSWFPPTTVSKSIRVNSTSSEFMAFAEEDPNAKYKQIEVFGFDPVLIIVPLGIGLGAFFLKRNGMLKIKQ